MKKGMTMLAVAAGFSLSAMAADVTGYVIDEKCSTKAAMKGDAECAAKCIKGGSPAVIVTDDGKVYKISEQAKIVKHAGHHVTITGKLDGDTLSSVDNV